MEKNIDENNNQADLIFQRQSWSDKKTIHNHAALELHLLGDFGRHSVRLQLRRGDVVVEIAFGVKVAAGRTSTWRQLWRSWRSASYSNAESSQMQRRCQCTQRTRNNAAAIAARATRGRCS